ncbi:hypothetical protein TNCV_4901791 [Trichonephila clavipes]|nr:hypothetical protein TNCV_4901791 [Trichonephila clavipes]
MNQKRQTPEPKEGIKRAITLSVSSRNYKYRRPNNPSQVSQSVTGPSQIAESNLTASCKRLIYWFLLDKGTELGHKIVPVRPPKF